MHAGCLAYPDCLVLILLIPLPCRHLRCFFFYEAFYSLIIHQSTSQGCGTPLWMHCHETTLPSFSPFFLRPPTDEFHSHS